MRYLGKSLLVALLLLVPLAAQAASFGLSPKELGQGNVALVRARLDSAKTPVVVEFMDRRFFLQPSPSGEWVGPVACELKAPPGRYPMRIVQAGRAVAGAKIKVNKVDYGVRRITVAKKFQELTPQQIARYEQESRLIRAAYKIKSEKRLWRGEFARPTQSEVVSKFGRRSVVNGEERSPHSGVDLRGAVGDPVRAPADGRVVLVLDSYFGGLMVVLDHGQGLITNYLHLSHSLVREGQEVKRGQIFAEIGKSGRVTGPHLHFGVVVQGVKVDPLPFLDFTRAWAQYLGD